MPGGRRLYVRPGPDDQREHYREQEPRPGQVQSAFCRSSNQVLLSFLSFSKLKRIKKLGILIVYEVT